MTYMSGDYFSDGQDHFRVAHFSNPAVNFQNVSTGDASDGDNARSIREIKHVIAAYKDKPDTDGDGIMDSIDNCPTVPNPLQEDADNDTIGDVCDICTDTDDDNYGNPGYPNNTCPVDNCPDNCNTQQLDADEDGIGDVCDPDDGCFGCGKGPICEIEC